MIRPRAEMPSSGAYSCLDRIDPVATARLLLEPKREEKEGPSRRSKWSSLAADTEARINTATRKRTDSTCESVKAFVDLHIPLAITRAPCGQHRK
jgi:hypothetical protein